MIRLRSFVFFVWFFPIGFYWVLPFELPIEVDYAAVFIVLFSISSILISDYLYNGNKTLNKASVNGLDLKFFVALLFIAYLSIPTSLLNMYLKGVEFSFSFSSNREAFTDNDGGGIAQLSVLFSGALIFCLMFYDNKIYQLRRYKTHIIILTISIVSLNMLVGNRQIFNIIAIIYAVKFLSYNNVKFFSKKLFIIICFILFFVAFFLWFQFSRQSFITDGIAGQMRFLYAISDITCTAGVFCESVIAAPFLYIFQYYGNEYHGVSALFNVDIDVPIFAQTLPVVYRRYSDFLMLPSQEDIRLIVHSTIESKYQMFPRFWTTMYSQLYIEFGYAGIILFNIIMAFTIIYNRNRYCAFGKMNNLINYYFCYLILIFGLMFFPLVEPILFFLICYLLLFNLFNSKLVRKGKITNPHF